MLTILAPLFRLSKVYLITFQVDDLLVGVARIEDEVESLASCSYDAATFHEVLSNIQKAVDEMNLYSYTNLASWVSSLDKSVSINTARFSVVRLGPNKPTNHQLVQVTQWSVSL